MTPSAIKFEFDDLPAVLKSMRAHVGLSQREVADKLGISSAATISHYESGRRTPGLCVLKKLVRIYGFEAYFRFEIVKG
jgi:transcriptional regulator with XRE-family HTH domain